MNYQNDVKFAAKLLDDDRPEWFRKVDLNKLTDLGDCKSCILYQVYGEWSNNNDRLFYPYGLYGITSYQPYLPFWRELIKERQNNELSL